MRPKVVRYQGKSYSYLLKVDSTVLLHDIVKGETKPEWPERYVRQVVANPESLTSEECLELNDRTMAKVCRLFPGQEVEELDINDWSTCDRLPGLRPILKRSTCPGGAWCNANEPWKAKAPASDNLRYHAAAGHFFAGAWELREYMRVHTLLEFTDRRRVEHFEAELARFLEPWMNYLCDVEGEDEKRPTPKFKRVR
jgi:hypothetical protein